MPNADSFVNAFELVGERATGIWPAALCYQNVVLSRKTALKGAPGYSHV